MNPQPVTIEGTLQPDGTLQLDQKVNLSPGRVQVVVQPLPKAASGARTLAAVMDEIHASQQARGYTGRSVQEMQAEEKSRQEDDDDYDERWEKLWHRPPSP